MNGDDLAIADAVRELRKLYGEQSPGYREVWGLIADARVPATRKGKQWRVARGDLATIAKAFRLDTPCAA